MRNEMTLQTDLPQPPAAAAPSSRARRAYTSAQTRGTAVYDRGRLWIENQDPGSRKGATIGWVRRAARGELNRARRVEPAGLGQAASR